MNQEKKDKKDNRNQKATGIVRGVRWLAAAALAAISVGAVAQTAQTAQEASAGRSHMAAFAPWELGNGATVVYHRATPYQGNPVIKAEKPWEFNAKGDPYAAPFSGGVWADPDDGGKLKMWYSAGGGMTDGLVTCYAESDDGLHWVKPVLDVVEGTNIVDTLEHDCLTVVRDLRDTVAPERRYKMFSMVFSTPAAINMVLKYSADGIHWSEPKAMSGELYDRCSAYYDPIRETWVLSLKDMHPVYRRARAWLADADPVEAVSKAHRVYPSMRGADANIHYWFNADSLDERHPDFPDLHPQIYNHDATAYEGGLLGQFVVWKGPENPDCNRLKIQKRNEICIGWSEDGLTWQRPDRRAFIGVNDSVPGAWDAGNVQSVAGCPVVRGDSLLFYYSGRYESKPEHASNFATGVATLRRDGFASIEVVGEDGGQAMSPEFVADGPELYLNADLRDGGVDIDVVDGADGSLVQTFPFAAIPGNGANGVRLPVGRLKEEAMGRKLRLRLRLTGHPKVYSFRTGN